MVNGKRITVVKLPIPSSIPYPVYRSLPYRNINRSLCSGRGRRHSAAVDVVVRRRGERWSLIFRFWSLALDPWSLAHVYVEMCGGWRWSWIYGLNICFTVATPTASIATGSAGLVASMKRISHGWGKCAAIQPGSGRLAPARGFSGSTSSQDQGWFPFLRFAKTRLCPHLQLYVILEWKA